MASDLKGRYSRQILYAPLGAAGQEKLSNSSVAIIGMGAIGCATASLLARAGVGLLRLYDRDYVEKDNLQRQILYDENDVAQDLPKAKAAELHLGRINSRIRCESLAVDVNASNIRGITAKADLVLDGSDNFETRLLINDACFSAGRPWIYAACVQACAMSMSFIPGHTPCFRCLLQELPPPGSSPTCDTAGILNTAAVTAASLQATAALKLLSGDIESIARGMISADLWNNEFSLVPIEKPLAGCPVCEKRRYDYLDGRTGIKTDPLCGRRAVQITPPERKPVNFTELAARLGRAGAVRHNEFLFKFSTDGLEMTIFPDGRAIIKGARNAELARAFYARYLGI
jgi:adenylyltransferase/sulfurtransferase